MEKKQINFNTLLIGGLTITLALTGYLAKSALEDIKTNQGKQWTALQAMMPRQEIEVRIEAIKTENTRNQSDLTEIRARLNQIETQLKQRP